MENFIDFISQPWHWSVSGAMIVVVVFFLLWFGGEFGVSSNLRTLCAIGGAGRKVPFFNFDWKKQLWNLVFIFGAVIGGFMASHYLSSPDPVDISASTEEYLASVGIKTPQTMEEGAGFVPHDLFFSGAWSLPNLLFLTIGGFLIGFGTRWAGGCTSGHAISGLANLQLPSLIAVIGFFMGGLLMTHLVLPHLLPLF